MSSNDRTESGVDWGEEELMLSFAMISFSIFSSSTISAIVERILNTPYDGLRDDSLIIRA